jgi:uncharacterized protein (DUF1778 family)
MGARTKKPKTVTIRLTYADRLYLTRTARLRGVTVTSVVAEAIAEHRDQTVLAYATSALPTDTKRAA